MEAVWVQWYFAGEFSLKGCIIPTVEVERRLNDALQKSGLPTSYSWTINILDVSNFSSAEWALGTSQCTAVASYQMPAGTEHSWRRFIHAHSTELGVVDLTKQLLDFLTPFWCETDWPNRLGFTSPLVVWVCVVPFVNVLNRRFQ